MNIVDIVIVLLVVLSVIQGFRNGLIESVFSLAGLIAGIAIASWNYQSIGAKLAPMLHIEHHSGPIADAIWFCLIALAVMLVAGLVGMLIKSLIHGVGLGWLDRLTGMVFGFLRGAFLVTLCIVTLVAFFPNTRWLAEAQLASYFSGIVHLTTHMTPEELKVRVLDGLQLLENNSPQWLHPK
jgi:membrane protein required for colicin V production